MRVQYILEISINIFYCIQCFNIAYGDAADCLTKALVIMVKNGQNSLKIAWIPNVHGIGKGGNGRSGMVISIPGIGCENIVGITGGYKMGYWQS